jgi:glycosyltransferase involved in cell wall biosynthesis
MSIHPTVSIGIPVRNGQRFISEAIDSLLGQTFCDFEIVICDNASTDQTEEICRDYMSRDPRVRYYRNSRNLGPAGNHNKCFDLSQGKYFRWHAHDDLCAPTYLEQCVKCLDENPDVVLAYPKTLIVDEVGKPMEEYNFAPATNSPSVAERFSSLVLVNHRQHRACEIFGLMRASALRQTPLEGAYARGDSVLLVRMALLGRFVELPERLFLSRCHSSQSMQTMPSGKKRGRGILTKVLGTGPLPPPEWWDASRKGKANFPEWNLFKEYWVSIGQAPLSNGERMHCRTVMLRWLSQNVPKLVRDLIYATENLSNRFMDRVSADWADAEQFNERLL